MIFKTNEITCTKDDFTTSFNKLKQNEKSLNQNEKKISQAIKYFCKKLNIDFSHIQNKKEFLDKMQESDDLSIFGLAKKVEGILGYGKEMENHYLECLDKSTLLVKVDLEGKVIWANKNFSDTTGYNIKELVGIETKKLSGDFSQEQPKEFWANLWETVLSGKTWTGKIKNKTKDGDYYWTDTTIVPNIIDSKIQDFMVIRTDITETQDLKISLQEKNLELKYINEELIKKNLELEELSMTDFLTGLSNRRSFDKKLQEERNRAKREKTELSLMIIDIDLFKHVNDTYGHDIGDLTLKTLADIIKQETLRAGDFKARLGGEEFAMILPGTKLNEAKRIGENLRKKVENMDMGHLPKITISIGISSYNEDKKFVSIETFFKKADNSLYLAKASGRNNVKTCDDL